MSKPNAVERGNSETAFSGCERDCAITAIHDVGFIPQIVDGKKGFKVLSGGGTSIMPRLAPTLFEFVPMDELFHTENQVEKFLKTIEGATYRLRQ